MFEMLGSRHELDPGKKHLSKKGQIGKARMSKTQRLKNPSRDHVSQSTLTAMAMNVRVLYDQF